jgi:hypothetical protein
MKNLAKHKAQIGDFFIPDGWNCYFELRSEEDTDITITGKRFDHSFGLWRARGYYPGVVKKVRGWLCWPKPNKKQKSPLNEDGYLVFPKKERYRVSIP